MSFIRTFIGIELAKEVRERACDLVSKLYPLGDKLRWIQPETLHLTLGFLGDVEDRKIYEVYQRMEQACEGFKPFRFACHGLGGFPTLESLRVLWLGIQSDDDTLERLHLSVDMAIRDLSFPGDSRKFQPHITLARQKVRQPLQPELYDAVKSRLDFIAGPTYCNEVVVYSSTLEKNGPVYQAMARIKLG
jgi:2'-5' RNA ligase